MNSIKRGLILITLCTLISCGNDKQGKEDTLEGIWESIGYGRFAEIKGDEFVLYDVTEISCIPILDGDIAMFAGNISVKNDTMTLKDGINKYQFSRTENLNSLCSEVVSNEKANDPLYNFETVAHNFKDHYAYFELRNVNWDSLYTSTKQKITPETTDPEFYNILVDMLDSFDDGHIGLNATKEVEIAAETLRQQEDDDTDDEEKKEYGDLEIGKLVANSYLKDKKKSANRDLIHWGIVEGNIGYLQINLMMGHADVTIPDSITGGAYWQEYFGSFEDMSSEAHTKLEVEGLNKSLDRVMMDLAQTEAMILDVRFNGGGKDEVAMEIIRRFNPKRHEVFNKKAKYANTYTPPNHIFLEAMDTAYMKPVYLLTSRHSASATEIMTLSSLKLEHVKRIGAHTEGVFSDVLEKALPNGWEVELSNEVYLDTKGINYEGKGIQPHIDFGYPSDGQSFFRYLAKNLDADKNAVLKNINKK